MYIGYSSETLLTSLILVSRVWARPSEVQCGDQRSEGDKWFDGCRWCVCQHGRSVCSSSDCSIITSQLPACHSDGSSWRDGCYFCKCDLKSIECTLDKACLQLLHRDGLGTSATENDACVQPTDERCVCGIDGVPSCTAEVIDRNSLSAVVTELNPLLFSSSSLSSHDLVNSDSGLKPGNKEMMKLVYDSERNVNVLNGQVFASQTTSHSAPKPGQVSESHSKTTSQDETASLLVVSAKSCRYGERWYGGSLRCYCGKDNATTCGDPGFVASRIDGFRLDTSECVEGHTWDDKNLCTMCTCQANGLAFCQHSPSCRLPFIIRAVPLNRNADRNFQIVKRDQNMNEESEFAGEIEHNFIWNKRADEMLGNPSSITERRLTSDKTSEATGDFKIAKSEKTVNLHQDLDENSVNSDDDDIDGSGDSEFQATAITWTEDGNMKTTDIQDIAVTDHRAIPITNEETTQTVTNPNSSLYEALTVHARVATGKCTPRTAWVEGGCKRCVCNSQGDKKCDLSRCNASTTTTATYTTDGASTTSCIGINPHCRPMIRPPPEHVWNRTGPIVPGVPPGVADCGRFKPGDKFWDDCNLCECTTSGPICTGKNCS